MVPVMKSKPSFYIHTAIYIVTDCSPGTHMKTSFIVGETRNNDYSSAFFQGKTIEDTKSELMPQIVQSIMHEIRVSCLEILGR